MNTEEKAYYEYVVREIARLQTIKRMLEANRSPLVPDEPKKQKTKMKVKPKARSKLNDPRPPKGYVDKALLDVLSLQGATNAEVREKLKAANYQYSLHELQIGKALNRLASRGQIVKMNTGERVEFTRLP